MFFCRAEEEAPRTPSPTPAPVEEEEEPSPAAPVDQSPLIQANDHWTNQLKNDLGIGLAPPPAVQFGSVASPSASLPPQVYLRLDVLFCHRLMYFVLW